MSKQRTFQRLVQVVVVIMLTIVSRELAAADLLVFVSAFAPGKDGGIHAFQLDPAAGKLVPIHRTAGAEHPFFIAVAPNNKYLYAIHAPGEFGGKNDEQVAAYEVVGRTGQLKLLNRQSARGSAACYLEVDATNRMVLLANYNTGSVASYAVRPDGSLSEPVSFVQHAGKSVNPERQEGPHAHCFVISPDNRYAYAADLGLDQIIGYRLDVADAKLLPNRQPFVRTPPGAGPRHMTFHPNRKHCYAINELANSVTMFDYEAESGVLIERQTLPTLPDDFAGTSYCADLKITPDGRFLYGTNRGHDSIAAYRIEADGQLKLLAIEPSLGKGPQNLAITPGGELLLCANMPGNNVAVFRIDAQAGRLTPVGEPLTMPSPSCIMIR